MIDLGLFRIGQLLAGKRLPWRAIHVAGTNGKGTTCAYVSAMLSCYNRSQQRGKADLEIIKHGRLTSPHLIDRWDCITINEETISQGLFESIEAEIRDLDHSRKIGATEFELLTATAFEVFDREKIDIGVVEVGVGGRLDATNIIGQVTEGESGESRPAPFACGIASIGLDHQGLLGSTVEEIARQKCGIIKEGADVVAAVQEEDSVNRLIEEETEKVGGTKLYRVSQQTSPSTIWALNGGEGPCGLSQDPIQSRWANGALAVQLTWRALEATGALQKMHSEAQIELLQSLCEVPSRTSWRGRLQTIDLAPLFGDESIIAVLDGSHNAQSARQLRKHLDIEHGSTPREWVIAASDGKDISEMLRIWIRPGDIVNAVEFGPVDGMPWVSPMSAEAIAAAAESLSPGTHRHFGKDIKQALRIASEDAVVTDKQLVIAGSLYLVGDVLRLLRSAQSRDNE